MKSTLIILWFVEVVVVNIVVVVLNIVAVHIVFSCGQYKMISCQTHVQLWLSWSFDNIIPPPPNLSFLLRDVGLIIYNVKQSVPHTFPTLFRF